VTHARTLAGITAFFKLAARGGAPFVNATGGLLAHFAAQRSAATWWQWRDDRVTQAAVAWVLLTVFARYCEDNNLVSPRWLTTFLI
jgi:hypothetical protein